MLRITVSVALLLVSFSSDAGAGRPEKHRRPAHRAQRKTGAVIDAAAVNNPALAQVVGPGSSGSRRSPGPDPARPRAFLPRGDRRAVRRQPGGAIADFQKAHGLAGSGIVDEETWKLLNADTAPALVRATRSRRRTSPARFTPVPEDMMEKAALPALGYSTPLEEIAENFHASPTLLTKLNPGKSFDKAGEEILVPSVRSSAPPKIAKVVVDDSRQDRLRLRRRATSCRAIPGHQRQRARSAADRDVEDQRGLEESVLPLQSGSLLGRRREGREGHHQAGTQ